MSKLKEYLFKNTVSKYERKYTNEILEFLVVPFPGVLFFLYFFDGFESYQIVFLIIISGVSGISVILDFIYREKLELDIESDHHFYRCADLR